MHSCAMCVTIFNNSPIIPAGFKFTELHALTPAARSYALLIPGMRPDDTAPDHIPLATFSASLLKTCFLRRRVWEGG